MLYTLEQGPTERGIIEQAMRMNRPLPETIKNAPVLAPGLFFYLHAYNEIATSRRYMDGMPLVLEWTVIHTWCQAHGCDEEEENDVKFHVWSLDEAEREHAKKNKGRRGFGGNRHQHAQPENTQPSRPAHPQRQRKGNRRK